MITVPNIREMEGRSTETIVLPEGSIFVEYLLPPHQARISKINFYDVNGNLHRSADDPASVTYHGDFDDKRKIYPFRAEYYYFGKLHRKGKPAIIAYNADHTVLEEHFLMNGEYHVTDEPNFYAYFKNSSIHKKIVQREQYRTGEYYHSEMKRDMSVGPAHTEYQLIYTNGKPSHSIPYTKKYTETGHIQSRTDGPTREEYFPDGTLAYEEWRYNNVLHRADNKPAVTAYTHDGKLETHMWYVNGERRRTDGKPGHIEYDYRPDGCVVRSDFHFDENHNLHCTTGPALTRINQTTGEVEAESYHIHGRCVDDDLKAAGFEHMDQDTLILTLAML